MTFPMSAAIMPRRRVLAAFALLALLVVPSVAGAQGLIPERCKRVENRTVCKDVVKDDGSVENRCEIVSPAPGLDCILETFANIASLILGVTGSFALLMFVYGGFTMLSSGGSEERVTKGKTIIRNAVIGIFLILLAGYLIRYGLARLGVSQSLLSPPASSSGGSGSAVIMPFV